MPEQGKREGTRGALPASGNSDAEMRRRDRAEVKRRRRERFMIIGLMCLIIASTYYAVFSDRGLSDVSEFLGIERGKFFIGLINLNIILIILLIVLVVRNFVKLVFERRSGILGSRLKTRLVVAFFIFSIIPTLLLMYGVNSFVANSFKSWFNLQIEQSLEGAVYVARAYNKAGEERARHFGRRIAREIAQQGLLEKSRLIELDDFIAGKVREYRLSVVEVYDRKLRVLAKARNAGVTRKGLAPPSRRWLRRGLEGKEAVRLETVGERDLIRSLVPIHSPLDRDSVLGLVTAQYQTPKTLSGAMHDIAAAGKGYRQLASSTRSIQAQYILFLIMVTLAVILLASWFGFYLAKGIVTPIQQLAEGTAEIAGGNLTFHIDPVGDDEIGVLVNSFNRMTDDLHRSKLEIEKANAELETSNAESERRRRYMAIVLGNVAAGVVSIDAKGLITTMNKSAERLLGVRVGSVLGRSIDDVLSPEYRKMVRELVDELVGKNRESIERQVTLSIRNQITTLLVSLTRLIDEEGQNVGYVAVFDDLSQLIKAQRAEAWREVARRIAHEIKNPLTPIQLSAQRLQKKYGEKFGERDHVFQECTSMIVKQVDELKRLVDEFSNFARLPASNPTANDLNGVIEEALLLFQEGHKDIRFEFQQDDRIPIFALDRDQIKRVIMNLVDNAVAATDGNDGKGKIEIITRYEERFQLARIELADNGPGIRPEDRYRLFEPYFSTKRGGTGLGLAIVSKIISDHNGYIRVRDNTPRGTRFIIELPIRIFPVRAIRSGPALASA